MTRRYSKRKDENPDDVFWQGMGGILIIAVAYFGFIYQSDKNKFWYEIIHYLLPVLGLTALLVGLYVTYLLRNKNKENNRLDNLLLKVKENDFENTVINFIDRFGKEGKKESWKYRTNYSFDWSRLNDFRDTVIQNGIEVSADDYKDIIFILKHFIDTKEKDYLNNGISPKSQHKLSELNKEGSDLEHLIVRLYNAMGYVSKRNGGSGDQGADVIASKNGDNVLIQAKCYNNPVSNKAVQEAFSALGYHGCNKAVVITTSTFTPGAVALAKANSVDLIDGDMLKRMLLEHLDEVWI